MSTGGVKATGGAATGGMPATGGAPIIVDAGPTCPPGSTFCDDFEAYAVGGPASQWNPGRRHLGRDQRYHADRG